ncbi:MAG: D-glucuronyl C5-epimerase family protein [Dehalococcoidia bacterium]
MDKRESKYRFAGYLALALMLLVTSLWTYWGVRAMCYQGWWEAWYSRLPYFAPAVVCLGLTLIMVARPRAGGWLIIVVGGAFTGWWWWRVLVTAGLTVNAALNMLPVSGLLVVAGVLSFLNGYYRQRLRSRGEPSPSKEWLPRKLRYVLAIALPLVVAIAASVLIPLIQFPGISAQQDGTEVYTENDRFRNLCVQFVRAVAERYLDGQPAQYPPELEIKGNWELDVTMYHQGEIKGIGGSKREHEALWLALQEATLEALNETEQKLSREDLEQARFLVTFYYPPSFFRPIDNLFESIPRFEYDYSRSFCHDEHSFSFMECKGEGKEVVQGLVIVRSLDKELIFQKIEQGKEFLFRAMNEAEHGFYKKYDTLNDDFGSQLHTVYSASIIYTLLKIYDFDRDERILDGIAGWGDFLLSMQSKDEETYGGFHYSYYPLSGTKENSFPVGTTALSIFTLLDLYQRTNDPRYLEAAKLGGDWLLSMQRPDGIMYAYKDQISGGEWACGEKESLLYNGQVLSALSRLYRISGETKYYDAAERIARHFSARVEKEGCFLGDDYRWKNPISSAWVVMSLLDFYKINPDDYYKNMILRCGSDLVRRQAKDLSHPLYNGSWYRAYSTSGNGWLAEVMLEMYRFCQQQNVDGCDKYKEAVIRVIRWIIQNTYSEENTFFLKEPEKAIGGIFWNYEDRYVRTDSLCHALNAYVGIIGDLEDGTLLSLPEDPIGIILSQLRR